MAKFYSRLIATFIALYLAGVLSIAAQSPCVENGTLLFIENFDSYDDGLNPSSAAYSTKPLPTGMTDFWYATASTPPIGIVEEGAYSLVKKGDEYNSKLNFVNDDHTSPTNPMVGRSLIINGGESSCMVYTGKLNDLNGKNKLHFSFWVNGDNETTEVKIFSSSTDSILSTYSTENSALSATEGWVSHGFDFVVPNNENSIRFEITSSRASVDDSCIAYDDIAIYLCNE